MSVVIANPGAVEKKFKLVTSTEYTVPAGGQITVTILPGDTIILE